MSAVYYLSRTGKEEEKYLETPTSPMYNRKQFMQIDWLTVDERSGERFTSADLDNSTP